MELEHLGRSGGSHQGEPVAIAIQPTVARRAQRRLPAAYWSMWTASTISALGDGVALVAFPLLATTYTSDARWIAGLAVAQRLPWLLCSLIAGTLADRFDRRRLFAIVEGGRMAVLVLLAVVIVIRGGGLLELYVAAFALGTFETAFSAASMAAIPSLVDSEGLSRANGYLYAGQTAGEQFIGPALGGVMFAVGTALPFAIDGVSFAVSGLLLAHALRGRRNVPAAQGSLMVETRAGLRWFLNNRPVRRLAGTIAAFAFCQAMVLSVLVLLCLNTLHLSPSTYGLFLAVGAIGNLAGGAIAGRVTDRISTRAVLLGGGLAAAVAYAIVGLAPNATVAAVAFIVEAVAVALGNVASVSLRQRLIPAELLGRVGNILRMCIFGAMPLGAITAGVLAELAGVRTAILAAAVIQVVLVSALAPRLPAVD
jgi:MFS family permease